MLYDIPVIEMRPGDEVQGFYILKDPVQRVTAAGKPFLTGKLSDRTGSIEMKIWNYSGPLGPDDAGAVVKIRGTAGEYRGAVQLTVTQIRRTEEGDDYDLSALVPVAPIRADEALAEIRARIAGFSDPDYKALAGAMLARHETGLRSIPAAKSVHHGFVSGLLMHTSNMLKLADFLAGLYSACVDRELLLTGTLLHDMAKEREFLISPAGLVTDYSVPGQLLGHPVMGAQETAEVAKELGIPEEKSMLVQHMLLSHHGEPEFGAAVRPQTAEAELLSCIDRIDSRMEIYRETMEGLEPGQFSQRVFALEKKIYKHRGEGGETS